MKVVPWPSWLVRLRLPPWLSTWLEGVDMGLTLWSGTFEEDVTRLWLRWCDRASADLSVRNGLVIPTGAEGKETERQRAETERQRAETERQRADRLADRLRAMGINPDEV